MKKYTDNKLFNDMANTVDEMNWEDQLKQVEFDLAHLGWCMARDQVIQKKLQAKYQEICGEIGHDFDDGNLWMTCINCGAKNDRTYDEAC